MILCIADKKGRIQYNRLKILQRLLPELGLHVHVLDDKISFKKYNAVYYSHFSLYDKKPCLKRQKKLTSVTSHKCLTDKKKTKKVLERFDAVSANNLPLYQALCSHRNFWYLPNGVDTEFFSFAEKGLGSVPVFGWVGNRDRAIKNFESVVEPLMEKYKLWAIASSKSDKESDLKSPSDMVKYYHRLDYFLVTSSAEGTPNPGLEALSCGIPVLTTRVGNMTEVVKDGENGFFVDDNLEAFRDRMGKLLEITPERYKQMSLNARRAIEPWDWKEKAKDWKQFLGQYA